MQKTITSKAISLFLALLLSLGVFATVQVASTTAFAETIGGYEVNFATGGTTASANGVDLTATIHPYPADSSMAYVNTWVFGTPAESGHFAFTLTGDAEHNGPVVFTEDFFRKQGETFGFNYRHYIELDHYGNISDLQLSLNFTPMNDLYGIYNIPSQTINGQTLEIDVGDLYQAGYNVYPYVWMQGAPTVAGRYRATLASVKANYSSTITFVAEDVAPENGYRQFRDGFIMPTEDVDDLILNVTFIPNNNSSSGSSSGSNSSSSSNSSNAPNTSTPAPVNQTTAVKSVKDAVAAAKNSANGASVSLKNVTTVTLDTLKQMAKAAGNTALKVNADSLNADGLVDVRISFDPSQAGKSMNLAASTTSPQAQVTGMRFTKFFSNNVSVVSLSQKGSFGMPVRIAAKVDPKLNTSNLVFYSYDEQSNTFTRILNPQYKVDKNGYVHFTTSIGGNIVISDKPLERK